MLSFKATTIELYGYYASIIARYHTYTNFDLEKLPLYRLYINIYECAALGVLLRTHIHAIFYRSPHITYLFFDAS